MSWNGWRFLAAAAAWWVFAVSGAEADAGAGAGAGDRPASAREGRGGGRSRSGFRERMETVNRQLKEKFPAEYAEIEKMRETDRFGAMRKTAELAEKAGIEMPFGRRGMRPRGERPERREWREFFAKLKEKFPTEFDAIEKKLSDSPQSAMTELRALAEKAGLRMPEGELPQDGMSRPKTEPNRNRNRMLVASANRILARTRPEDYARLEALRQVDDDEARAFLRKLVREEGLTPEKLLGEPDRRQVRSVSYSDKDIEAQDPSANSGGRSWGGWGGGRGWGGGGWGGGRGWSGGHGNWGGPPRF